MQAVFGLSIVAICSAANASSNDAFDWQASASQFAELADATQSNVKQMKDQMAAMVKEMQRMAAVLQSKEAELIAVKSDLNDCRKRSDNTCDASAAIDAPGEPKQNQDRVHRHQPGGKDCAFTKRRRKDGGIVKSIHPTCFPFPLLDVHTWQTGLSSAYCKRLIDLAEAKGAWTEKSSLGFRTADIGVEQLALSDSEVEMFESFVHRLGAFASNHFMSQWPKLDGRFGQKQKTKHKYDDLIQLKGKPFIIRYNAGGEDAGISLHKDNSDISFIVLLSDPQDFEGGGTSFEAFGQNVLKLRQGEALIFNGQLPHRAAPISNGRRYVLSGFIRFNERFLDMKRRSTMATSMYQH
eukprot:TRINITY_DN41236_c0_g1_i1.p1 TRINITY_DN41236_c0_g1~~TRINITY_DN41236_c0_g1_i1.p1  ORF type:complete len:352 (-),score=57.10 TRINITY_DN41236_c0_g1_i1:196-1251(-)